MSDESSPKRTQVPLEIRNQIVEHFINQREILGKRIDSKTEMGYKVAAQLDGTLITLSGGALIFSMTFVEKIAPAKQALWLLFAAWIAFGTSMIVVMLSMWTHQQFVQREILKSSQLYTLLNQREEEALQTGRVTNVVPGPVKASKQVGVLNWIAVVSFGFGMILLGAFVGYNLYHAPKSARWEQSRSFA